MRTWGALGIVAAVLAFFAPSALAAGPVAQATRVGPVPRQQQLQLVLPLNADLAGLESFAQSVNTPGSPQLRPIRVDRDAGQALRSQPGSQLAGDRLHARRRRHRRQARRDPPVRRRDDERSTGRAGVRHAACGVPRRPPRTVRRADARRAGAGRVAGARHDRGGARHSVAHRLVLHPRVQGRASQGQDRGRRRCQGSRGRRPAVLGGAADGLPVGLRTGAGGRRASRPISTRPRTASRPCSDRGSAARASAWR